MVERYNLDMIFVDMEHCADGEFVKYEDYEKLEKIYEATLTLYREKIKWWQDEARLSLKLQEKYEELLQKLQQLELDVEHFRKVAEDLEQVFVAPSLVGGGK
jgi:predicted ribosome quality control (RQC) complex YloA/Tae2 family protein